MTDDWPGILPHHKFVPRAARPPRSREGAGTRRGSQALSLLLPARPPQLSRLPGPALRFRPPAWPWSPDAARSHLAPHMRVPPGRTTSSRSPQAAAKDSAGWNQRGRPPCLYPPPPPPLRLPAAAKIAFPLPGFNHVTSPLGKPEPVPVALYVKSQFLASSMGTPHGSPSCPPHLRAPSPKPPAQTSARMMQNCQPRPPRPPHPTPSSPSKYLLRICEVKCQALNCYGLQIQKERGTIPLCPHSPPSRVRETVK